MTLPRNLDEAVRLMEKSDLVRATLGDHIFAKFIANKREEIDEYTKNVGSEFDKQVSDYETGATCRSCEERAKPRPSRNERDPPGENPLRPLPRVPRV